VMDVVSHTVIPDEKSKICGVSFKKELIDPKYILASARPRFRMGNSRCHTFNINLDALRESQSRDSAIATGEESSHDGSAFYDSTRNIIVAVSGNGNNCRDVVITHLTDGVHGDWRSHPNIIPFGSHGQYPIFDGVQYAYFCQSEDEDNDRFGRLDLDSLEFEELARIPEGFCEFCSGCCASGKIFALNNDDNLYVFDPETGTWENTGREVNSPCRLLTDPLGEGRFYILSDQQSEFEEVDAETYERRVISNRPGDFDLNQNGEALIVALPDMSRVLFTYLEDGWTCYLFEQNEWIQLPDWERARNGSAHLVIIPEGPTALFHIDGHRQWSSVSLA